MTIAPLQARFKDLSIDPGSPKKTEGTVASSFGALLDRVGGGGSAQGTQEADAQRAMMELLRIEMMQSTLSLGGDGAGAESQNVAPLSNLLSGLFQPLPGTASVGPGVAGNGAAAQNGSAAQNIAATPSGPVAGELNAIGETASTFLGTPYRFGGEGPNGIDCSSFVQQVFQQHQVELPRTAREQIQVGTEVPVSELRKGDLVFFRTYASYPSHVGIYLGDGKMIHASSGKGEVTVSDINSGYYRSRFIGAKRIV